MRKQTSDQNLNNQSTSAFISINSGKGQGNTFNYRTQFQTGIRLFRNDITDKCIKAMEFIHICAVFDNKFYLKYIELFRSIS